MAFIRLSRLQLFITIVVISAGLGLCWITFGRGTDDKLERNIIEIVQQSATEKEVIIDFSRLTSFQWDKLYVFAPYTTLEHINRTLGFEWRKAEKTGIEASDQIDLLVFVHKGKVVNFVEHERGQGDFVLSNNNVFDPYQAKFTVVKNYQGNPNGWLELRPLR